MQTTMAADLPQNLPEDWTGLPYWLRLGLGFLLIGVGASILTAQLRAALPPPEQVGQRRALHHLYAPVFGATFATAVPFFLPGFDVSSRWLIGLVSPFLWAWLYDWYRVRYQPILGALPDSKDLINGGKS